MQHQQIKSLTVESFLFQVQILQTQVGQLAESQASTDDRYSKVRQENVTLNQR